MPDHGPFYDPDAKELDTSQILREAIPIAGLIVLFGVVALVPFGLAFALDDSIFGLLFAIVAQFVVAVGSAIVLLYVVARGVQLADGAT